MLQGKSTSRILQKRLTQVLFDTYDQSVPGKEKWYELGHFLLGVSHRERRIVEVNRRGQETQDSVMFSIEYSGQPAQNTIDDYELYNLANGIRGIALLTGDKLRLFRRQHTDGQWIDNRVSCVIDTGYEKRDTAFMRLAGRIDGFEIATIKGGKVSINNGILVFDKSRIKRFGMWPQPGLADNKDVIVK